MEEILIATEAKIRQIIYEVYDCCFAGPIRIIPLKTVGFQVLLGMPSIERPVSFAVELNGDLFFKHIKELLREASLSTIKHYSIQLEIVDFIPIHGHNNVFKIQAPLGQFGGNVETIAPIVGSTFPDFPDPQPNRPKPNPIINQNTSSTSSTPDWYGTQEEFDRIDNINPNINYFIYAEVDS